MTIPPASLLAGAEPSAPHAVAAGAGAEGKRAYRANPIQWAMFTALLTAPGRDNPRLRAFLSSHPEGPVAEPLTPATDIRGFSCGVKLLDDALRNETGKAPSLSNDVVRRTFVALHKQRVVAYFTQRLCFVRRGAAEAEADAIPIIQLQRLAVDRSAQGRGFGTALLHQAVWRALTIGERYGAPALWVPALSPETKRFYLAHGLQPMPAIIDPLSVLLTFDNARRASTNSAITEYSAGLAAALA